MSFQTCLRLQDCVHSKENRDTVFCQMRRAMDLIHYVVKDGVIETASDRNSSRQVMNVRCAIRVDVILSSLSLPLQHTAEWDSERATASTCLHHFSRLIELARPKFNRSVSSSVPKSLAKDILTSPITEKDFDFKEPELLHRSNSERDRRIGRGGGVSEYRYRELVRGRSTRPGVSLFTPEGRDKLLAALDKVCERTQDFTDSAYTSHEYRENILLLCDRAKLEINHLLRMAVSMEQYPNAPCDIDAAIESVLNAAHDLSHQLTVTAHGQAVELPRIIKSSIELINTLRTIALNHEIDRLQECADRFHEHIDHMLEVSNKFKKINSCVTTDLWRINSLLL